MQVRTALRFEEQNYPRITQITRIKRARMNYVGAALALRLCIKVKKSQRKRSSYGE